MKNTIAAIIAGGTNPSQKKRIKISMQLWGSLSLENISSKPENLEASKNKVTRAIANITALEKSKKAMQLLNAEKDASWELDRAKEKMQALLEDLKSGKKFSTSGSVIAIHIHIRRITR